MAISLQYIDPEIISIGSLSIKWYGLSYALGILIGGAFIRRLNRINSLFLPKSLLDNIEIYYLFGIVLGGRVGYMLIYAWDALIKDTMSVFYIWEGGMSFHGGAIVVVITTLVLSMIYKVNAFTLGDLIAMVAPIGIFFGRIANFINAELRGRYSELPWSVIFYDETISRHPSQLYEAFGEGVLLFFLIMIVKKFTKFGSGVLISAFLILYSLIRAFLENYREPDQHIGFIFQEYTMGQLLSVLTFMLGIIIYGISVYKRSKA